MLMKKKCDFAVTNVVSTADSGQKINLDAGLQHDLPENQQLIAQVRAQPSRERTHLDVKTQNIVATLKLSRPINLTKLANNAPSMVFEPEQFPAAMYALDKSLGANALIFSSGKVVLVGIKSSKMINKIVEHMARLIEKYYEK